MRKYRESKFTLTFIVIFTQLFLIVSNTNASSFGAEIFCTMREAGNDHESSWEAAYSYIKRQKGGIFKTSPNQAAAQIVETVIREREEFSYCVEYLNKLHPNRKLQLEKKREEKKRKKEKMIQEKNDNTFFEESFDRYSY